MSSLGSLGARPSQSGSLGARRSLIGIMRMWGVCVTLVACGGAEPGPEVRGERAAPPKRDVVAPRETVAAPAPVVETAQARVEEVRDDVALDVAPAVDGTEHAGEPSVVTPLPQLCREACANAHRLVLAELPVDTAKAMRDEVERALQRECPGRCLQRASIESARCFVGAKSALELAACPQ